MTLTWTNRGNVWKWVPLPGHIRNEPLDCRNYALAGFRILNPDLDALESRRRDKGKRKKIVMQVQPKQKKRTELLRDDW